jgi:hypothetical protein
MVKVKIIHGFWKNDDARRIGLLVRDEVFNLLQTKLCADLNLGGGRALSQH